MQICARSAIYVLGFYTLNWEKWMIFWGEIEKEWKKLPIDQISFFFLLIQNLGVKLAKQVLIPQATPGTSACKL